MPPQAGRSRRRVHAAQRRSAHRVRRFAALVAVASVAVATLLVTAFGPAAPEPVARTVPAPANRLLPSGLPDPLVIATQGALRIQLPIAQGRVTAIGYHGGGSGALALDPLGRRGNQGVFARLVQRIFGGNDSSLVWYQLGGGSGAPTSALVVGAAPGTDVFAPVDGTIAGITDLVINGTPYGKRIDIRPLAAPSLVVSVTRIEPDPSLAVGTSVAAGTQRLGTVLDFSRVERQALARFTQDEGNHVTVQVFPAAALSLN